MYRRSTKQRVALAALLAATATVVTLDFRQNPGGPIRRAQNAAVSVVAPLQEGVASVFRPVGSFLSSLGSIGSLRKEVARLEAENQRLEAQQRQIPATLLEIQRLQQLLETTDWTQGRRIGARVIGVDPSNVEWLVTLDKGTADGLSLNQSVVSSEGLIGRVTAVQDNYATVLMLIDPQHAVGARLTGSGETGVVGGRGEDVLEFELIDPKVPVADGETVVTSGYQGGIYPANIPIGRVTKVTTSRDGLTKTALVAPFVDFTRLDVVLVLLDSGKNAPPPSKPAGSDD